MTGNVKKYKREKGFEPIKREMLQDEDNLSIEAIGLLCNLTSYPETWELHKTQLYRRFAKSGRRKVQNAWNELVIEKYIVQLRKRNGNRWEYIYYHSDVRFTDDEINDIVIKEKSALWDGKMNSQSDQGKVEKHIKPTKDDTTDISINDTGVQSNVSSGSCTDKRETINEINYKEREIIIDTVIDTGNQTYTQEDEYFKSGRMNNTDKIPEKLARCLYVLGKGKDTSNKLYRIILNAKKDASKMIGRMINFEDMNDEVCIEDNVINIVSRVMEKFKYKKLSNVDNYLYISVRDTLIKQLGMDNVYNVMDSEFAELWE